MGCKWDLASAALPARKYNLRNIIHIHRTCPKSIPETGGRTAQKRGQHLAINFICLANTQSTPTGLLLLITGDNDRSKWWIKVRSKLCSCEFLLVQYRGWLRPRKELGNEWVMLNSRMGLAKLQKSTNHLWKSQSSL